MLMKAKIYLIIFYTITIIEFYALLICVTCMKSRPHCNRVHWISFLKEHTHEHECGVDMYDFWHPLCLSRKKASQRCLCLFVYWNDCWIEIMKTWASTQLYTQCPTQAWYWRCISYIYFHCFTKNQLQQLSLSRRHILLTSKEESCNKLRAVDIYSLLNDIICKCQMNLGESMRFFYERAIHVVIPPMSLKTKTSSSRWSLCNQFHIWGLPA